MFLLLLLWLLLGLCLGLLSLAAALHPTLKRAWLILPLLGMLTSLLSGLLGLWLLGRDTATGLCFCLPVFALVFIPRLFTFKNSRKLSQQAIT